MQEKKTQSLLTHPELSNVTSGIVSSAFKVHQELGPGLLESVYHHCMVKELESRNLQIRTMVPIPLLYKGEVLNKEHIIDILVADQVIVVLKSVDAVLPVHHAQVISYLKLANKPIGFLINFHVPVIKQGIKRFVNNVRHEPS